MFTRRHALALSLACAAAGPFAGPALARGEAEGEEGPYLWRNVVVGAGGFAPGIVFSPAEPGLAYLRTDMGGAYRWEDEARRWVPLQDHLAEGNLFGIESVAPDPVNADMVYLAAGMYRRDPAAILRSADQGASWSVHPVPFRMGGNEDGRGLGERLAVDPHAPATLLFGSRHDGLQRSKDSGASWRRVEAFPWAGLGLPEALRGPTHAGIGFVLFDPRPGQRRVFAGIADADAAGVVRSEDGGESWAVVPGGPADLLPVKAALDPAGALHVTYANGVGPNGITRGAVWRLSAEGEWSDITPDKRADAPEGGYMGVAVDRTRPGHLLVTTMDRWEPGDTIWRSTDGGRSWEDLRERSERDVSASPFLKQGEEQAEFGHWTAGLALDPFDGRRAAYTTGATVYVTDDITASGPISWRPWVRGIEQTAIISLLSPLAGAPLVSGFGDIAGFVHEDLERSPEHMHLNPHLTNNNNLDYAGLAPNVLVRSGNRHANQPADALLAWSEDGGLSWHPLRATVPGRPAEDLEPQAHIVAGADGRTFAVSTPTPLVSHDRGGIWVPISGLPERGRPVADKADPRRFYALDLDAGRFLASEDGGRSFAASAVSGLPADLSPARPRSRETPYPLIAEPGRAGALWLNLGPDLYRTEDGGRSWRRTGKAVRADLFTLGAPAPGSATPTLFVAGEHRSGRGGEHGGEHGGVRGLFRSTDGGARWTRIDDDAHLWGHRYRVIEGDPRRFGRLYVGTDGRGILYGEPRQAGLGGAAGELGSAGAAAR